MPIGPIYDVTPFDDDETDHSNDFMASDEGWFTPAYFQNLAPLYLKHYNEDELQEIGATGSGLFDPFLRTGNSVVASTSIGFNTDDNISNTHKAAGLDIDDSFTQAIQLGDIPIVYLNLDGVGGPEAYYRIDLDINENNLSEVSLEELQIFTSTTSATLADYHSGSGLVFENNGGNSATDFVVRFDLDASNAANEMTLRDNGAGQGKLDYTFYFPVATFGNALATDYVTLFSQFGPTPADDAGFAEWNIQTAAKISGVKFNDHDGDATQDAGDEGLSGFTMFIDLDADNKLDANERTAVSGAGGAFTFSSLVPNTNYVVREVLTAADVDTANNPGLNANDYLPDVNGDDVPDATFWDQTTGDANGDHLIEIGDAGTYQIAVGNRQLLPAIAIDKVFVNVTGGDGDALADAVGDVLNYTVRVTNTGNVTLTGVTVVDPLTGQNISGVTLAPGAFNDYPTSYTLTQADLDKAGNAGADGDIDNTATADSNETNSVNDSAEVPLVYNPAIAIDKVFVNVTGGDGDALADAVGDVLNYTVRVTNTGNVTLTGVTVVDPLTGQNISGVTLAPGAFNDYPTSYTLTQADLDKAGNAGADGDIDNTATADSNETNSVNDSAEVPLVYNPAIAIDKVFVNVTGGDGDALADAVGDVLNYTVRVTNTGNVTLTGVTVVDPLTGQNISGVTLAPGAFNDYPTSYTLTQADLDKAGNAGADGDIDNTATADSNETNSVNDSAEVPLVYNPAIAIDKVFVNVTGGDGDALADAVGDVLNYTVRVTNTGNVTLTGVTVVDPLTGQNISGVTLAPGAFNDYPTSYTLTQADLDKAGNAGADGDIDNTATADSNETNSVNDSAEVPLVYNPLVSITKNVKTDQSNGFVAADSQWGPVASTNTTVTFQVIVSNVGNITLTGIGLTDVLDGTTLDYNTVNAWVDLNPNGVMDAGEDWFTLAGNDGILDSSTAAALSPGESFTVYYSYTSALGNHENEVTVDTTQGATDDDLAHYYVVASDDCVGVRTPGFWKNWTDFWDNDASVPKQAGQPGFAAQDLIYAVDLNGDNFLNKTAGDGINDDKPLDNVPGLLIGDYDKNGVESVGEDTIFISLTDANKLIDASQKQLNSASGDGLWMLGRDVVATWLNYLANNPDGGTGDCIGTEADAVSARSYLNDAIDWLQANDNSNDPDVFAFGGAVKTTSNAWKNPGTDLEGDAADDPYASGAAIHTALDYYNNTGHTITNGLVSQEYCCSADDPVALAVLAQIA